MTKRVLILWAKPTATNLGIQALAAGAEALSRIAFPDVEVTLHDHDTPGTPLGKDAILRDIGRRHGQIKDLVRGFDLVLDTGSGDSFTDIYGPRRLSVMSYVQQAALVAGVPLVLNPQTIGPFDTFYGRSLARRTLKRASRVFSRDTASTRYSSTVLGRHPDAQSPDVVFALPVGSPPAARSGIYLNVSGLLWRPNRHVDYLHYRQQVLEYAREVASGGEEIVLFPHVLRVPSSREDDVTAVEEAAAALGDDASVFFPRDLDDVRTRLASATAVVGARMHACLNALSVGTPAVAWAYSRKFAPLMSDLGWRGHVDLRDGPVVAETLSLLRQPGVDAMGAAELRGRALGSLTRVASSMAVAVRGRDV